MTDASYAWIYEDPFHSYFLIGTTAVSVCSNGFLMFILYTTRIGPYAYLLAVFAVCDIITSCAHITFQPTLHMTYGGFYFFPRQGKIMIAGASFDSMFALIFIATYYQTFLVLAYHFVYRYKIVSRREYDFYGGIVQSFTNNWTSRKWTLVGVTVNIVYITGIVLISSRFTPAKETRDIVPKEIEEIYGINLRDLNRGFTVLAVRRPDLLTGQLRWHWSSAIGISMLISMFLGTASVILYCMWQTHIIFKSSFTHLPAKTRKIQKNLFNSLLIQTAIPVIFSYFPLSMILLFGPVTGISLGAFGNVLVIITSIFPSIDAFFVLFFIRVFRIAVIRRLHLPIKIHDASTADASATTTVEVLPRSQVQT